MLTEINANRKYKDSVFTLYFSEPSRLIELYNAIEGTNFPLDTKIEINTLEDALFKNRINDISFVINGELVVILEHQSTLNPNMPLRMLMYLSRIYEKIIPRQMVYSSKQIIVPTPRLIVLYNGDKDCEEYTQLNFSDAYKHTEKDPMFNLKVDMYNINYTEAADTNNILNKSKALKDYALFIFFVKEELKSTNDLGVAITNAMQKCMQQNVMVNFLQTNGSEVYNMLFTEWKLDDALKVSRKEGHDNGMIEGAIKLCKEKGGTVEDAIDVIKRWLHTDEPEATKLANEIWNSI